MHLLVLPGETEAAFDDARIAGDFLRVAVHLDRAVFQHSGMVGDLKRGAGVLFDQREVFRTISGASLLGGDQMRGIEHRAGDPCHVRMTIRLEHSLAAALVRQLQNRRIAAAA